MVKTEDLEAMQRFGRLATRDRDIEAFETAVEYLLVADSYDIPRLIIWFEEGVRNSAENQYVTDILMTQIKTVFRERLETYGRSS